MASNYTLKLKGYVGGWDFDPDYVDYVLEKNKDKDVSVVIDSLGGSLFSGTSISQSFRLHGNVNAILVGYNASAATVAAMGAKRVSMDRHAMFLVHKASTFVFKFLSANSDQIQSIISSLSKDQRDLQKIDMQIAAVYASRCKKKKEDLLALMKEDRWLDVDEALQWGFIDEIVDLEEKSADISNVVACAMQREGIPLPPACSKRSIWGVIMDAVGSFNAGAPATKYIDMTEELQNVCSATGAEQIKAVDGKVSLTVDSAKKLESKLAEDKKKIEDLEKEVESLKKAPGAASKTVVAEHTAEQADDFLTAINTARDLYKALP